MLNSHFHGASLISNWSFCLFYLINLMIDNDDKNSQNNAILDNAAHASLIRTSCLDVMAVGNVRSTDVCILMMPAVGHSEAS